MADQQSSHASLSNAVNTYYSKKILKDFEPQTVFYSSAPMKEMIPKGGGKTVEFTRYQKIAYLNSNNTDEFTAQQMYLSAQVVTATLKERDGYVQISKFADLTAIGGLMERVAEKTRNAAAKTIDILVRNDIGMAVADVANASSVNMDNLVIDGGTLNSTGTTARVWSHDAAAAGDRFPMYHNKTRLAQSAQVTSFAKSAMTVKTLQHAAQVLRSKDVDYLADGTYHCITHPYVIYQLQTESGFKGWFSPTTSDPVKGDPTSVKGVIAGVTLKESTLAYKFALSGDTLSTASGSLYCSLLFGDEAFGVTEITGGSGGRTGFEFFIKQSGPQTTSDPTNKKKQAAFSITAVAKILNKSAGLWVLTTHES
jgi:N4-gp56 family major capsid protein